MSEKQNISERVRILRARRNWTQEELGDAMGYDRNYISMVEGGREPGPKFEKQLTLLESSPIGDTLTNERALREAAALDSTSRVREEAQPNYDLVKKVIFIEERGNPDQLALLSAFLDAVCAMLGFPRRKKKDGGDLLILHEEITDAPQPQPASEPGEK